MAGYPLAKLEEFHEIKVHRRDLPANPNAKPHPQGMLAYEVLLLIWFIGFSGMVLFCAGLFVWRLIEYLT